MLAKKPPSHSLAFPAQPPSRALFVPVIRSDSDLILTPGFGEQTSKATQVAFSVSAPAFEKVRLPAAFPARVGILPWFLLFS